MIRALIPVIQVSRHENKDLVARFFHSAAAVEKKKTFACKKYSALHGNLYHKLFLQRQSISVNACFFIHRIEPEI